MKNMLQITFFLFGICLFVSPAMAFQIGLDFDSGGDTNYKTTYGWSLVQQANDQTTLNNLVGGDITGVGIVTEQNLGTDNILNDGDTFSETFNISISGDVTASKAQNSFYSDTLNLELTLNGYIDDYTSASAGATTGLINNEDTNFNGVLDTGEDTNGNGVLDSITNLDDDTFTSIFTSGTAKLYDDTNDDGDNSGEPLIASYNMLAGSPISIEGNVFGGAAGAGDDTSFLFSMDSTYDSSYLGDTVYDSSGNPLSIALPELLSMNLVFASTSDNINTLDGIAAEDNGDGNQVIKVPFQYANGISTFQAVPEPTTLLLFGTGLLGLAAFGRKKFMKKS